MARSLESSRPILSSKRNSHRFSSYSASPSVTPSEDSTATATAPSRPSERRISELKEITDGISRLESKQMAAQRFAPSKEKSEYLSKLALTAKVERALRSRLSGQDAVWRPRVKRNDEKAAIKAVS